MYYDFSVLRLVLANTGRVVRLGLVRPSRFSSPPEPGLPLVAPLCGWPRCAHMHMVKLYTHAGAKKANAGHSTRSSDTYIYAGTSLALPLGPDLMLRRHVLVIKSAWPDSLVGRCQQLRTASSEAANGLVPCLAWNCSEGWAGAWVRFSAAAAHTPHHHGRARALSDTAKQTTLCQTGPAPCTTLGYSAVA